MDVHDAGLKASLVQQLELRTNVERERASAASHHNRSDEQMELVDQAGTDRVRGEFGAADGDVAARGLFELTDRVGIELALSIHLRVGDRGSPRQDLRSDFRFCSGCRPGRGSEGPRRL